MVDPSLCDIPCDSHYHNGTTLYCGGTERAYAVYEIYAFVHQTADGCYDPWRFIWYQVVAVLHEEYGSDQRVRDTTFGWYLHAASINSGKPLFPYQHALGEEFLLGLQYDLDSSRIVGYSVPSWKGKTPTESWRPHVQVLYVNSQREDQVRILPEKIQFPVEEGDSTSEALFSTGITALDALHNVYYLTVPIVDADSSGALDLTQYQTLLYAIDLNVSAPNPVLLKVRLSQQIAVLEANSKTHNLFALMRDSTGFYYCELGHTEDGWQGEDEGRVFKRYFKWTFTSVVDSLVNPYGFELFLDKYYQVQATSVDPISNVTFLVYKDSPDAEEPYQVKELNTVDGYVRDFGELNSPSVQATWLVNTDPMIPLTLPAPKLLSARFTMDGRSILVSFDAYTAQGALPIDDNGDFIPDGIDNATQHIGPRNSSDIFD
jgi:hypothetical protein